MAHTIESAQSVSRIDDIYVSTNDGQIRSAALSLGASVIDRPTRMATAHAQTEPALIHALETIEQRTERQVDVLVMLQVTSPLRGAERIEQAIDLLLRTGCDSVVSVVPDVHYYFLCDLDEQGRLRPGYDPHNRRRTQDIPPRYRENGAIYVMRRDLLLEKRCRMGGDMRAVVMEEWESIDIDTIDDLRRCELIFDERYNRVAA